MTLQASREQQIPDEGTLIERGWDFGFESFFPGGLFGGLPRQAAVIVESIWNSGSQLGVIDEVAQTWEELEALEPELFEPILETRPGRVADSYPQDVSDDIEPEDDVAHTWGHLAREFVGGIASDWLGDPGQTYNPPASNFLLPGSTEAQLATIAATGGGGGMNGCDGMTWAGGAPPKGYKVVRDSCGNGVLRKVRRRRRRRMLTASDKTDIASIVSMVGKGQLAASLINRSAS